MTDLDEKRKKKLLPKSRQITIQKKKVQHVDWDSSNLKMQDLTKYWNYIHFKCCLLSGFTRKNLKLFVGLGNLNETGKMHIEKHFFKQNF